MSKHAKIINPLVAAFVLSLAMNGPVAAQTAEVDALFDQLAEAGPDESPQIEGQIVAQWARSGSPAMDLLLRRGEDALESGASDLAVQHFSALIDHAPDFAEGYNGRATAYYLEGQVGPALADIHTALALNPRHFGAMRGLAIILEELDRPKDALEVYVRIQEIAPHAEGVSDAVDRLSVKLDGLSL